MKRAKRRIPFIMVLFRIGKRIKKEELRRLLQEDVVEGTL